MILCFSLAASGAECPRAWGMDSSCPMLTMLCGAWQGPAYSRHTLPGETEPVEQAQEILILQRRSLRVDASGSDRIGPRKEVREEGCACSSSACTAL